MPLVIQLTDDEKMLWKVLKTNGGTIPRSAHSAARQNLTVEEACRLSRENAKDIIACGAHMGDAATAPLSQRPLVGFDPKRTFIFSDFEYMGGEFYKNCMRIAKARPFSGSARHPSSTSSSAAPTTKREASLASRASPASAKWAFQPCRHASPVRISPCKASDCCRRLRRPSRTRFRTCSGRERSCAASSPAQSTRCALLLLSRLSLIRILQDPYFRMTRDIAPRLKGHKPALIESRFFPALKGDTGKMSASDETSAVYVTDTPKQVKTKINKYAFSGGRDTVEEHRALGANLAVDISWKWLNFFLDDDAKLASIGAEYAAGRMLSGEIKAELIALLSDLVLQHQARRAAVTDADVNAFMSTAQRAPEDLFG